jgi:hypothetical protein
MARLDDKGALDVSDDGLLIFLLSPLSITDTFLQSYQLLHHSQEPGLFPVSLLHIELSGSALGASKIASKSLAAFTLCHLPGVDKSELTKQTM